jgi:hypothetical protein
LEENMEDGRTEIQLDGSYGLGPDAELTIVTSTKDGRQQKKTYTVPYAALNLGIVQKFCDLNLILGYEIVKGEARAAGLKDLGL